MNLRAELDKIALNLEMHWATPHLADLAGLARRVRAVQNELGGPPDGAEPSAPTGPTDTETDRAKDWTSVEPPAETGERPMLRPRFAAPDHHSEEGAAADG